MLNFDEAVEIASNALHYDAREKLQDAVMETERYTARKAGAPYTSEYKIPRISFHTSWDEYIYFSVADLREWIRLVRVRDIRRAKRKSFLNRV